MDENKCLLCGEDRPEHIQEKGIWQECQVCGMQWRERDEKETA